jgi:hypothetical protein
MDWLALLTAFGAGSVVSVAVQSWLENERAKKQKLFIERRESFVGLLDAYHRVARENSPESRLNFGYWELRCRLVASDTVRKEIENFANTFPSGGDRKLAEELLLAAMRKDLEQS